ncbi:MAG: DUF1559 domain-containing protein [Planctomycetales bacterium]|nr:DUF1559 domain-containing protein [Planctomycetales bacterium]
MPHASQPTGVRGFTLVELLVVIAIIGVLVSLLLPAVQSAREAARRSACANNLHQLGIGCLNYAANNGDALPPGFAGWEFDEVKRIPKWNFSKKSLFSRILPFLEEQQVYDQIDFEYQKNSNPYADPSQTTVVSTFICPSWDSGPIRTTSEDGQGLGSSTAYAYQHGALVTYAGCSGSDAATIDSLSSTTQYSQADIEKLRLTTPYGPVYYNGAFVFDVIEPLPNRFFGKELPRKLSQVVDGTSNSFLIGEFVDTECESFSSCKERPWYNRPWYLGGFQNAPYHVKVLLTQPNAKLDKYSAPITQRPFSSLHPGIVQFVFCDGSIRTVRDDIDFLTYLSLGTVNGGEVISGP